MKMYRERLLSDIQLKRLRDHKYSCTSNSLCDALLQPWWNWLVAQVPLWVAPNLITILGLLINIITTLILVCYSPDAKTEAPRWACFLCGFGLFVYQSLDAIDGKQARRTGNSNPLGELFDHGCDSVSTVFVALSACIAVQLGHHPAWMFFQCFCAITLFYCAHWQTYVSGTLRFGKVDVTEAQYTIIAIHMISTIFGPSIWSLKGTSVLSPVIPFCMVLVPAFIIYVKSQHQVYEKHPALYILAFGLVAAKITNKLVVAHMTKSEMEYIDISLLGPSMLFFNQYFNFFIPEHYVLWVCMIFVTVDFNMYCRKICMEICEHLHIQLFRIPYLDSGSMLVPTSLAHHHGRYNPNIITNQLKSTSNSEKNGTNINRIATRSRKH